MSDHTDEQGATASTDLPSAPQVGIVALLGLAATCAAVAMLVSPVSVPPYRAHLVLSVGGWIAVPAATVFLHGPAYRSRIGLLAAWTAYAAMFQYMFFGLQTWPYAVAILALAVVPIPEQLRGWSHALVGAAAILVVGGAVAVAAMRHVEGVVVAVVLLMASLLVRLRSAWHLTVVVAGVLMALGFALDHPTFDLWAWHVRTGLYAMAAAPLMVAFVGLCPPRRSQRRSR